MPLTPIPPNAGIPTYLDTGVANAIRIAVSGLSSYTDFQIYNVVIANPNTGNTTFQINSLAALPLLTATGDQVAVGALQAGMIATIETRAGNAYLLNAFPYGNQGQVFNASGNFTPQVSGNYLIELMGGGGGGGGGTSSAGTVVGGGGGKPGSGGQLVKQIVALVAGTAYPIVIGPGGAGGAASTGTNLFGSPGTNGTNTTFNGATVVAPGGAGAVAVRSPSSTETGDAGWNGSGNGGGQGGAGGSNAGGNGAPGSNAANNSGGGGGGGGGGGNNGVNINGTGGAGGTGGSGYAVVMRVS